MTPGGEEGGNEERTPQRGVPGSILGRRDRGAGRRGKRTQADGEILRVAQNDGGEVSTRTLLQGGGRRLG